MTLNPAHRDGGERLLLRSPPLASWEAALEALPALVSEALEARPADDWRLLKLHLRASTHGRRMSFEAQWVSSAWWHRMRRQKGRA